jgi:eukaryotic-like serine/threonine-protein kinase
VEFLERLAVDPYGEQWLARDAGEMRIVHIFDGEDRVAMGEMARGTHPWLRFAHPRVVLIHDVQWSMTRLLVIAGDERGTQLLRAVAQLTDAGERERWLVAELAAVAEGLAAMAAHVPGFVHRRACDEEIVIGPDGHARLRAPIAQVAIATKGGFLGRPRHTPSGRFLSPEQVRGHAVSPATDVFQLAMTLHCALSGKFPIEATGDFEMLTAITKGPPWPVPPTRSPGLAAVVLRAMARDPAERYANPADFAAALRGLYPGEAPPAACATLAALPPRPPPNRSPLVAGDHCTKRWDELASTDVDSIRHCSDCRHDVVHIRSVEALVPLLGKRCVAFRDDGDN